ncbi:alpha/beta hydrolase-fold protein [Corynebacterium breve]|uniref:Alpha/beta hydrolase-fold protein n=1 Tax=Corynebacterium breve TaxID=3049799 RepID=A0ABY8VCX1_9CORY|nr:alpha/beta hydrolase-fold protein [Corynebacterium breve]WIM67509.1 alpha/beta hydrolase-fold protein [Corynebacterium breve]
MRSFVSRSPRTASRRAWLTAVAIPTALIMGISAAPAGAQDLSSIPGSSLSDGFKPGTPQQRTPIDTEYKPQIEGLPEGVEVDRIEWLTNRRVAVFIKSAAMPQELIQVQILLARDWHSNPTADFPEVWALDGLRARDDESGWTIETNIEQFYADKNVNVILPVGGESSFYADWQKPDNGKHYMWESFLTKELVPILDNEFRSNGKRAILGISMGGTAAVNLAERNPALFDFVGSFSGYLDTTSTGMPEAIKAAQLDAGGYKSDAMWGPAGSQAWIDHDPKLGVETLKGKTVYVSAGNGKDDFGTPGSVAKGAANPAGVGLEVISRMSTATFEDYARKAGLEVIAKYRPSGVHSWEYWQFEMAQAWPYIANSLALSEADRGADCEPVGAIAEATKAGIIGTCLNNEYGVAEGAGKAQDFRDGTAFWSPETGAQPLFGSILAKYNELGGPAGWLGFPKTGETKTPDGKGRYVHFENGSIYWTANTGAYAIPGDMFTEWGKNGYENGDLKYPTGEAVKIGEGYVQPFQGGFLTRNPDGSYNVVHGGIAAKYGEMNTARSNLGYPTSNEKQIKGGAYQEFEKGNIYWSQKTDAHVIYYGDIFNKWGESKWEQGPLGYPTTDMTEIPTGGTTIDFEGGRIYQMNGVVSEERN